MTTTTPPSSTLAPLPPTVRTRPVAGAYDIDFVSVEVQRPLAHGATSGRLDYFDNIAGDDSVQARDVYLSDKRKVDAGGRRTPLYGQQFLTPGSDAQAQRFEALPDVVRGSGLLDLARREPVPYNFRDDNARGLVQINLHGTDARGPRADTFVARLTRMPQAVRDVVRAAQTLGNDMLRSGIEMPEYP